MTRGAEKEEGKNGELLKPLKKEEEGGARGKRRFFCHSEMSWHVLK